MTDNNITLREEQRLETGKISFADMKLVDVAEYRTSWCDGSADIDIQSHITQDILNHVCHRDLFPA